MVTLVCAALVSTASALVVAPAYPMRAAVRVAASRTAAPEMLIGRSWILAVRKTVPQFPMFSKGGTRAGGIRGADGGDGGIGSTAGSSDDEGDNMPMMQMWKRYEQLLEETPLLMKALTSMTGFALGDILAQKVIQKVDSFDILRLLRLASFGFLVHGTTSHVFYGWLDGKFPGTSAQVVFAKVLVDQVFWAPIFGMMFFRYVAAAELNGIGNVFDKMKDELVTQVGCVPVPEGRHRQRRHISADAATARRPSLDGAHSTKSALPDLKALCVASVRPRACARQVTGSWTVWPLAHAINFRIIPSSQRVLYINTIQIGYNCFLSLIANRGLTVAPAPVTSLGKGKKNGEAEQNTGVRRCVCQLFGS